MPFQISGRMLDALGHRQENRSMQNLALGSLSRGETPIEAQSATGSQDAEKGFEIISQLLSGARSLAEHGTDTLDVIESEIISLSKSGSKDTPFEKLLHRMVASMKRKLIRTTKTEQTKMDRFRGLVQLCNHRYSQRFNSAAAHKMRMRRLIRAHSRCRQKQSNVAGRANTCKAQLAEVSMARRTAKASIRGLNNELLSLSKTMCSGSGSAVVYAKQKQSEFSSAVRSFTGIKTMYAQSHRRYVRQHTSCARRDAALSEARTGCNRAQAKLMKSQCKARLQEYFRRSMYLQCYKKRSFAYHLLSRKTQSAEEIRKKEYTAVQRIGCLMKTCVSGEKADEKTIRQCKTKSYSTSEVEVTYKGLPKEITNLVVSVPSPCSGQFEREAYSNIPSAERLKCLPCSIPQKLKKQLRPKRRMRAKLPKPNKYCIMLATSPKRVHYGAGGFVQLFMNRRTKFNGYLRSGYRTVFCVMSTTRPKIGIRGPRGDGWLGSLFFKKGRGDWRPLMTSLGTPATPIWLDRGTASPAPAYAASCERGAMCTLVPAGSCVRLTTSTKGHIKLRFNRALAFEGELSPGKRVDRCTARQYPAIRVADPFGDTWEGSAVVRNVRGKWRPRYLYLDRHLTDKLAVGEKAGGKVKCKGKNFCRLHYYKHPRCSRVITIDGKRRLVGTRCKSSSTKRKVYHCGPQCMRRKLRRKRGRGSGAASKRTIRRADRFERHIVNKFRRR